LSAPESIARVCAHHRLNHNMLWIRRWISCAQVGNGEREKRAATGT
jgi:hypothetical protein